MCKREFVGTMVVCTHDGTLLMQVKQDQVIGSLLQDKYHVLSEIGRGGMSIVYKARHEMMDKQVAVKMLQQGLMNDQTSIKRFQQEVQAASCLQHQNVITIFDFGVSQPSGQPYLVMDYLEGHSLSDVIKGENHITARRAAGIFIQACDALEHAHQKGVLHRDLKSSNIMLVDYDQSPDFVKVVDFGIAKLMPNSGQQQQNLTQTGEIFGSPIYMSPEQCLGMPLDARSDVYSMGTMLYEALTGQPPLLGANIIDTMQMHVETVPQLPSKIRSDLQIPKPIEMICMRALEKKAENRFRSMGEFRDALLAIVPLLPNVASAPRAIPKTGTRQNLPPARQGMTGGPSQFATGGAPKGNWDHPQAPPPGGLIPNAPNQPAGQTGAQRPDRFAPPNQMQTGPAPQQQQQQNYNQGQPMPTGSSSAPGQPQQYPPQQYQQQSPQQYQQQQAPQQYQQGQNNQQAQPQQGHPGQQNPANQQGYQGQPQQGQFPPGHPSNYSQNSQGQNPFNTGAVPQQFATGAQGQYPQQFATGPSPQYSQGAPGSGQQYATGAQQQQNPQQGQSTGQQYLIGAQGQAPGIAPGQIPGQMQQQYGTQGQMPQPYATGGQPQLAPGGNPQQQQSSTGPQHLMARTGEYASPTAEQQAQFAKYGAVDPNDDSLFGNPSLYGEGEMVDPGAAIKKSTRDFERPAMPVGPRHVPDHLPSKRINSDYSDLLSNPVVEKKGAKGGKQKIQIHAPELPKDKRQLIAMIVLGAGAVILIIVAACMTLLKVVKP